MRNPTKAVRMRIGVYAGEIREIDQAIANALLEEGRVEDPADNPQPWDVWDYPELAEEEIEGPVETAVESPGEQARDDKPRSGKAKGRRAS